MKKRTKRERAEYRRQQRHQHALENYKIYSCGHGYEWFWGLSFDEVKRWVEGETGESYPDLYPMTNEEIEAMQINTEGELEEPLVSLRRWADEVVKVHGAGPGCLCFGEGW